MTAGKRKISDQAVTKATGRTWSEWFQIIEEAEKRSERDRWPHKLIVSHIEDRYSLSPWWCQMVASSYESFRGRRELGETAPASFRLSSRITIWTSNKIHALHVDNEAPITVPA